MLAHHLRRSRNIQPTWVKRLVLFLEKPGMTRESRAVDNYWGARDILLLAQRLRRWPNIKTSLFQRVVFAG